MSVYILNSEESFACSNTTHQERVRGNKTAVFGIKFHREQKIGQSE